MAWSPPVAAMEAPSCAMAFPELKILPLTLGQRYRLKADQIIAHNNDYSTAQGHVIISDAATQLSADKLTFQPRQQQGDARGHLFYQTDGLAVYATSGQFQFGRSTAQILNPEFVLKKSAVRGSAKSMGVNEGVSWLTHANYTACPKGNGGWVLSAKKIRIDEGSERVTARHIVLRFKSVPIFYSPYLNFSLSNRRKSGFLLPSMAVTDRSGFEITLPFYWNIAANQDATLSLRHLQKRGPLFKGEYRYLSAQQKGQIVFDYLPKDNLRHEQRGQVLLTQQGHYYAGWYSQALLEYASDKDYFIDLGEDTRAVSLSHLERSVKIGVRRDTIAFSAHVQSFQTMDQSILPASRPYQRLPQLSLITKNRLNAQWTLKTTMEAVNFERSNRLTGSRFHLKPTLTYVKQTPSVFFSPSIGVSNTAYLLDKDAMKDHYYSTVPQFNMRSRLLFERSVLLGKTAYIQTLQPEIFYLYVPFVRQQTLPVFDTTAFDFNLGQLFRSNRFSGVDRVGDANQVSVVLSSSLLRRKDGKERLKLSMGQIHYFRPRDVVLPNAAVETRDASDIIFNLRSHLAHDWDVSSQVQWDTRHASIGKTTFRATYHKKQSQFLTLAYRFRKDQLEQTDVAFIWPLPRGFNGVLRWHYSLPEKRALNTLFGLEYDSCCWSVSLFMSRFVNALKKQPTQMVFLQFELKGLSSIGHRINKVLRQEIPSYQ